MIGRLEGEGRPAAAVVRPPRTRRGAMPTAQRRVRGPGPIRGFRAQVAGRLRVGGHGPRRSPSHGPSSVRPDAASLARSSHATASNGNPHTSTGAPRDTGTKAWGWARPSQGSSPMGRAIEPPGSWRAPHKRRGLSTRDARRSASRSAGRPGSGSPGRAPNVGGGDVQHDAVPRRRAWPELFQEAPGGLGKVPEVLPQAEHILGQTAPLGAFGRAHRPEPRPGLRARVVCAPSRHTTRFARVSRERPVAQPLAQQTPRTLEGMGMGRAKTGASKEGGMALRH